MVNSNLPMVNAKQRYPLPEGENSHKNGFIDFGSGGGPTIDHRRKLLKFQQLAMPNDYATLFPPIVESQQQQSNRNGNRSYNFAFQGMSSGGEVRNKFNI